VNAPRALAAGCLLLLAAACSSSPEAARDRALNTALEAGRLACLTILADPSIPREPGVDDYCRAVVGGCTEKAP